jgi:curli biogenesis system outer membrane secretion channel CsgG
MILDSFARFSSAVGVFAVSGVRRLVLATTMIVALSAILVAGLTAQTVPSTVSAPARRTPAAPSAARGTSVDTVIELVKGGMSEALIISSLESDNKPLKLAPHDILRLHKAGVSENIIRAMTMPVGASESPAARLGAVQNAVSNETGAVTPYPPDLPNVLARKRRVAVKPFDYSTVVNWVNYWFNSNTTNIGEGIRSMLTVRLSGSPRLTMVERSAIDGLLDEQNLGVSNRVRKGTNARVGQLAGADVMLLGDIVIFGRDDTTKHKGLVAVLGRINPIAGAVAGLKRSEKAVVGINLRLVDTETGEVIETAEARGESSRSSKDYGGVLGVKGVAVGARSAMTSSNFQETIIGEATSNAVAEIVKVLETRVPQLPPKARDIEGRVASIAGAGAVLTVGSESGVLRGDRFEILKIKGETRDPVTKEVLDLDVVKVGELVADTVRDRTVSGAYGGQPLSAAYATSDKGYAARLISK